MDDNSRLDQNDVRKLLFLSLLAPYAFLLISCYTIPRLMQPVLSSQVGHAYLAAGACWNLIGIYVTTRVQSVKSAAVLVAVFAVPLLLIPFVVAMISR